MKEVYNYSFNSKEQIEKLNLDLNKHIKVKNPLSSQQEYLRYHLVPNMLLAVEKNYRNFDNFSIYEIGKVFVKEENSFREEEFLCALIYSKKINNPIFYKAKEYLSYLLENINVSDFEIEYPKDDIESFYHPGRTGIIKQRKLLIGKVSEIHPKTIKLFDISGYIGLFYLDLNSIIQSNKKRIKFKELPKYPYVPFDISIIVDNKTTVKEVKDIIYKVDKHRIQNVEIFDIYEGSNLPEGKKSFAFNIKFYSKEKTLESNEIKELENSIINTLNKFYQVRC
jgi:phenylalanyl-tRNA synthetase beta chain